MSFLRYFSLFHYALGLLFFSGAALFGERIAIEPKVRSVIVYPDRALVTRKQDVTLAAGKHSLVFNGANPNLEADSLRAGSDSDACIVQGVGSHLERKTRVVDPALRKLEKELSELENQKEEQQNVVERMRLLRKGVNEYFKYLSSLLSEAAVQKQEKKSAKKNWQGALVFLGKERIAAKKKQQSAEEQSSDLGEQIRIVKKQIRQVKTRNSRSIRVVEITLQCRREAKTAVGFSYMIYGASWNVSYGMYLEKPDQMTVEYYGNIRQRTGEDWRDANLSLSTSTPAHGARRPTIRPLSLAARKVRTQEVFVQAEEKTTGAPPVEEEAAAEAPGGGDDGAATGGFTALEDTGTSLMFRIIKPARIPSGDQSHRVTIARFSLKPSELYHRIVGMERRAAHTTVKAVNNQSFPMLAGAVDVHGTSGFLGRSSIEFTPPKSAFLVGFGVDRSVRVERDVFHRQESAGVMSKDRIYRTEIRLKIANFNSEKRSVSVFERVPVSEVEEVVVAILTESTPGFVTEKEGEGVLRWNFELGPKEKREVVLEFTVRVPSNFPGSVYGQ